VQARAVLARFLRAAISQWRDRGCLPHCCEGMRSLWPGLWKTKPAAKALLVTNELAKLAHAVRKYQPVDRARGTCQFSYRWERRDHTLYSRVSLKGEAEKSLGTNQRPQRTIQMSPFESVDVRKGPLK